MTTDREPVPGRQLRARQRRARPSPTSPSTARSRPRCDGRYLRNGPNPIAPDPAAYHWFIGRRHAPRHRAARRRGRLVPEPLGADRPGASICSARTPIPGQPDDVFPVRLERRRTPTSSRTRARSSPSSRCASRPQVRPDLSTVGPLRLRRQAAVADDRASEDRPRHRRDALLRLRPVRSAVAALPRRRRGGELVRSEDIDIRGPSMVHDFAITERNVVFLDLPVVFDFDLVGKRPFPAAWKPDYGARVGVMPRDGGERRRALVRRRALLRLPPAQRLRRGRQRGLDVARHPKMFATDIYGPAELPPTLDRWTIDLDGGQGHRGTPRRPAPGVPTGRRARRRPAAPLRVRRALRHRRRGHPLRRLAQARPADRRRGRHDLRARHARRRGRVRARSRRAPARTRVGCSRSSTTTAATRAIS